MVAYNVAIERNGDEWVTSYDVWAKAGSYPSDIGDGTFVGNFAIEPSEDSIVGEWESPDAQTYYFSALSIYRRTPGLFFQLNGT